MKQKAVIFIVQLCASLLIQEGDSGNEHKRHGEGHAQNAAAQGAD